MVTAHPIPFLPAGDLPVAVSLSLVCFDRRRKNSSIHSRYPMLANLAHGFIAVLTAALQAAVPGSGDWFPGAPVGTNQPLMLCLFLGASLRTLLPPVQSKVGL